MNIPHNKDAGVFKVRANWHFQSNILQDKSVQLSGQGLKLEAGKAKELVMGVAKGFIKKREDVIRIIKKE